MIAVVAALAPIFLLIVIGYGLRRSGTVPDAFWPPAEKLTYYLFFPALLIDSTARADLEGVDLLGLGGSLVAAMLLVAATLLLLRRAITPDGPAFTSVFQGAIRVNTYVGLAAGAALFGREGTALMAVGVIAIVPLVNVLSVVALGRWGTSPTTGWRSAAIAVGKNPLIVAVLIGAALNLLGVHAIPVLTPLMAILGAASLPLGLLAVGAGLDLPAARAAGGKVVVSSIVRLGVVPGLTLLFGWQAGLAAMPLAVAVLYNGLPTSASAYVLSRQMGGDHTLMAGIITAQTLAAAVSLPLWLLLLGVGG